MKMMEILVLEKDLHKVTEALGEFAAVHFTDAVNEEQAVQLRRPQAAEQVQECAVLLEKAATLCIRLEVAEPAEPVRSEYMPTPVIRERLESIDRITAEPAAKAAAMEDELNALHDTISQVRAFRRLNVPVEDIPEFSFLHFATGKIDEEQLEEFQEEAGSRVVTVVLERREGEARIVSISSKKGRWAMESVLEAHGFKGESLGERYEGLPEEIYEHATARLEKLRNRREEFSVELRELGGRFGDELLRYRRRLRIQQRIFQAEENFGQTSSTCVISGWVPAASAEQLGRRLMEVTGERAVLELRDPQPGEERVPTLMRHSRLVRPFQLLISTYGFPGYREIEPTIFVGASFLVMFGLMFGDVGQGLVLALLGLVLARSRAAQHLRDIGSIMVWAGLAAMIGGSLFGEFFGKRFHPLWLELMDGRNPMVLLGWSVGLGVFMVSLGVVLNIINSIRRRDYAAATLDKNGLAGLVFYWGALLLGAMYAIAGKPPGNVLAAVLIGGPVILILLRVPILSLFAKPAHGGADAWIESGMDVFEMFVSFLSNTVSFVRVGAFALAHAGLAVAVYSLADMARALPAGIVAAAAVIVLGNIVIIAFEGMVVSIQCLRLEYYEFFTKFFKGEGTPFKPFSLETEV